jgi:hypothetical protein
MDGLLLPAIAHRRLNMPCKSAPDTGGKSPENIDQESNLA